MGTTTEKSRVTEQHINRFKAIIGEAYVLLRSYKKRLRA